MLRKRLVVLGGVALLVAACAQPAAPPTTSTPPPAPAKPAAVPAAAVKPAAAPAPASLQVGIIPVSNLTPLDTAIKLGYLQEEGLNVETTAATAGPALMAALPAGSLQVAYSNYISAILGRNQGVDFLIVANQNNAQRAAPDTA